MGRRRERRFVQSDLAHFLNRPDKPSTQGPRASIHVAGVSVPVPGHLATFYSSDAGRLRLTVPFLLAGLRSGQRCYLAASDEVVKAYMDALRTQEGLDVDLDHALASGQLSVFGFDGATVDKAIAFWEATFADSLSHGSTVIRTSGRWPLCGGCLRQRTKCFGSSRPMR